MGFYDLWVGRDMNGAMFLKDAPYATDPYTLGRLPKGLPFPVKCCWNGLVALDARPFTVHNVRIRYPSLLRSSTSHLSNALHSLADMVLLSCVPEPHMARTASLKPCPRRNKQQL